MTKLEQNNLVEQNLELVKKIAYRYHARAPKHVIFADIYSDGLIGLVEAAKRFDPSKKVPFPAFATIRIKGAILDAARRADIMPRVLRKEVKKDGDSVVGTMIQIPLEYDDDEQLMDWPSSERSQLDVAIENENKRRLRVAMESLSPRERAVIELYYGPEELRMSQVAEIIGVHESRVSQINVIALIKLRKKLVTRHGSLDPSLREE